VRNITDVGNCWFIYSLGRLQLGALVCLRTHVRPQCLPDSFPGPGDALYTHSSVYVTFVNCNETTELIVK